MMLNYTKQGLCLFVNTLAIILRNETTFTDTRMNKITFIIVFLFIKRPMELRTHQTQTVRLRFSNLWLHFILLY